MRTSLLFVLIAALGMEAPAACVCWITPLFIKADGSAIGEGKRYEDGDCSENSCQYPTQCLEFRIKGQWSYKAEICPACKKYGVTTSAVEHCDCAATLAGSAASAQGVGADPEVEQDAAEKPPELKGLPVNENFDPTNPKTMPKDILPFVEGTTASHIGFFRLATQGKVAANHDSDVCLKLDRDIEVTVFSVTYPKQNDEKPLEAFIAYEVKRSEDAAEPPTRIAPPQISDIRHEPRAGIQSLTLRVAYGRLQGKTLFLFRAADPN